MSFIRAEIRFKNAVFTCAFIRQGYKSIAELSRDTGIAAQLLYSFASLKQIPRNAEVREKLRKALCEDDYHLFDQYEDVVRKNRGIAPKIFRDINKDKFVSLECEEVLLLEDKDNEIDQSLNKESLEADIMKVLKTLKDREREMIKLCFGIGYTYARSSQEISEEYGISPDRVRQIVNKAIRRLRNRSRSNMLKYYLKDKDVGHLQDVCGPINQDRDRWVGTKSDCENLF